MNQTSLISFEYLHERPDLLSLVADWIYNEFWKDVDGVTLESLSERFQESDSSDKIPVSLIAFYDGKPVGTVSLIESDDDNRPHLTPWLAALYVLPEFRNFGVGKALVTQLRAEARRLNVAKLYLGTDKPDFYIKMGAEVVDQDNEQFKILRF